MQQTDVFKTISVYEYMKSMTIEEKIGQLFLLNLEGNTKFTEKTEYNDGIAPGGYLLFSYNIADSKEKVQNFTKSVREFDISLSGLIPYTKKATNGYPEFLFLNSALLVSEFKKLEL
jgi:beta-N-acetylhexosaminidase